MPENQRHAVSRTTGATTLARKVGDTWLIECLNHAAKTEAPNRTIAWTTASHPAKFCAKCKQIVAGKAERISSGLVDLPPEEPAPVKGAARKQVYVTKTGERRVRTTKAQGENRW